MFVRSLLLQHVLPILRLWLTTREAYETTTCLEATTGNWSLTLSNQSSKCSPLHRTSRGLLLSTLVGVVYHYIVLLVNDFTKSSMNLLHACALQV